MNSVIVPCAGTTVEGAVRPLGSFRFLGGGLFVTLWLFYLRDCEADVWGEEFLSSRCKRFVLVVD